MLYTWNKYNVICQLYYKNDNVVHFQNKSMIKLQKVYSPIIIDLRRKKILMIFFIKSEKAFDKIQHTFFTSFFFS